MPVVDSAKGLIGASHSDSPPEAPGCPTCGSPWGAGEPLYAAWLEPHAARRCAQCGARWAGSRPPQPLRDCARCGAPFLEDSDPTLCGVCRGTGLDAAGPESDLVRATESEVLQALGAAWSFVRATKTADYLDRVCRDVARTIDGAPEDSRVVLVDEDRWRVIGLPSGVVLLSRGMLGAIADEAELAFVLGREVAHVACGAAGTGLVRAGLRAISGGRRDERAASWVGAVEELSRFGRGDEREHAADRVALDALVTLGYDPDAPCRLLGRLRQHVAAGAPETAEPALALPPVEVRVREMQRHLERRIDRAAAVRVNRDVFRRAAGRSALAFDLRPATLAAPRTTARAGGRRRMLWLALACLALTALAVALSVLLT